MMKIGPNVRAFIAAALLAGLVLFVFGTLQYYGPESAVWRFHDAVKNDDLEMVDEVTVPPKSDQEAAEVLRMVSLTDQLLSQGYTIRSRDFRRTPNEVDVAVSYIAPNHTWYVNRPFVTIRTKSGWKVNVHKTYVAWNSMFSPRPVDQEIN